MFFCVFTWVVYVINILEKASLGTSFRLDTVASSTAWPDHILIRSHIFLYRLFQGILVNKVVRTIVQKSMLKIYAGKREGCCPVYFRSSTELIAATRGHPAKAATRSHLRPLAKSGHSRPLEWLQVAVFLNFKYRAVCDPNETFNVAGWRLRVDAE